MTAAPTSRPASGWSATSTEHEGLAASRSLPPARFRRNRPGAVPCRAPEADRGGDLGRAAAPLPRHPSPRGSRRAGRTLARSEEHTSELQSRENLVCRLLLDKKKS